MPDHIIELLTLGGHQHTRSIALDRDLSTDQAIKGYLLTPNAIGALRQIGEGLAAGRAQRAWKIVGPYGSGKSALAVFLAQLLAGPGRHATAARLLSKITPEVADKFASANRYTLAVIGARISFGDALANAINQALPDLGKAKAAATLRKQFDFAQGTYKGVAFNAVAGDMAIDFAETVASADYQGLALIIDEVGKFVEYAALYPEKGDLIALQQVAEQACKQNDDKLVVIAMLHQHFASYAAGVGRALNDEWHKVAARFEEIPFDEPTERYAHFAAHALGVDLKQKNLVSDCRSVYSKAVQIGLLRAVSPTDKQLFEHAEQLYPLHPMVLATLASVSKRYGQSERSFHAFLKGHEPKGLRDFAHSNHIGKWYRLPNLYDFLADGYSLRFRDLAAERRWVFAQAAIERETQDAVAHEVLKTIAVLELVQTGITVPITAETIAYALGDGDITAIAHALTRLVDQQVLISRRKHPEYNFAVSEAVNVEAIFEAAARDSENSLIITGISKALSQRLIVANRHYDETGTIRTMGIVVGTSESWPEPPKPKSDELKPDAWLKLVLTAHGSENSPQIIQRIAEENDLLSICACLSLSNEGRAALAEFAIWQTVLAEVNSKRLDPWTSRYVEGRLKEAGDTVERLVTFALTPSKENPGPVYWHRGQAIPKSEFMNGSQLASWLFGKVYDKTPRIVNELINKDKPAAAIVVARQRMFDVILSGDHKRKICGDTEYPPERLIHTTLLRNTGIWIESLDGNWTIQSPNLSAETDISAVWGEISRNLGAKEPQTLVQILEALAAPPFGVRAGPASIWVTLYLLINRMKCAVFERGSLVLELTSEHLQRMYKNPQTFTLREMSQAEESKKLLSDYLEVLSTIGCTVESKASYLEIARALLRWFARLPDYTKQTQCIGKDATLIRSLLTRATDPIELLTQTLHRAHVDSHSKEQYASWLTNALSDLGMALRRLQGNVEKELGQGFNVSGSLNRIRNQLQAECTKEGATLADARLKSFILRCTDVVLTDEKWLDSVASLIVQRPLDAWVDDTLSKFQEGLTDLCGQYHRWMQVVMHRGSAPRAAERYVGLTLTMAGGEESSIFVSTNESSTILAKELLNLVETSANGDPKLAAAALAQALLDLQKKAKAETAEEIRHG